MCVCVCVRRVCVCVCGVCVCVCEQRFSGALQEVS